jgi:hypothetical protein
MGMDVVIMWGLGAIISIEVILLGIGKMFCYLDKCKLKDLKF